MKLLSKLFGKRSTSDNVIVEPAAKEEHYENIKDEPAAKEEHYENIKDEPAVKTEHYINIKGCNVPTHFESKELQFDKYEFEKSDRCKQFPTGYANLYSNYLEWMNKCKISGDQQKIDETNKFFQQMKQEIYRGIDIPGELSEEEICILAARIAVYSCRSHGLSGYCNGNVYIDILTMECINCLLFTMIFGEKGYNAYLIDPAYVKENDWIQKLEIPSTLQKKLRIFVLLDNDVIAISKNLHENEYCNFGLWDVVNDQCFAAIRKQFVWHEREDGYPIDVIGYSERLEPLEKTPEITERINQCIHASEQTRRKAFEGHHIA